MDGLSQFDDARDQEAVSALLRLSELQQDGKNTITIPVASRTPSDVSDSVRSTPPLERTLVSPGTSRILEFKLSGIKRERDDTYTISFTALWLRTDRCSVHQRRWYRLPVERVFFC